MRYAIKLNEIGHQGRVAQCALDFSRALVLRGHQIDLIFLYHSAVGLALDETCHTRSAFTSFAAEWDLPVVFCSSAAEQRFSSCQPAPPFVPGGLGQWVDALLRADRTLTFGDPSR